MEWARKRLLTLVTLALAVAGCQKDDSVPGHDGLVKQISKTRVGSGADHWIEMKNSIGEWERTGLIFGYVDDYDECLKAIAGLKQANAARQYRCTPAN